MIIGNAYASEEELEKLGNLNRYMLQLKVNFVDEVTEVEKRATLQELHVRRGDITEYMVRSTEVRVKSIKTMTSQCAKVYYRKEGKL